MNKQPRIAILVLGYNDKENLSDTLNSLKKQTYLNFQTFYLDNASSDTSIGFVKENFPEIEIFEEKNNLGYAGAYAKHLPEIFKQDFDAAILLNSDILADENWLKELTASAFADEKIAFAQPKIYLWQNGLTNIFNTSGNIINFLGIGYSGSYGKNDEGKINSDREIAYASGCSLLIKKTAFQEIGNIDEKFFLYLEDQDWGWRGQMLGWKSVISAKSKLWHKYKFDSKRTAKFFFLERNRYFFIFKNYQAKTILLLSPALLVLEIGILGHSLARGYFGPKIRAYGAFLKEFGIIRRSRKIIQKGRKLPDRALFEKLSPVVEFEDLNSPLLTLANKFFGLYYKIIKRII